MKYQFLKLLYKQGTLHKTWPQCPISLSYRLTDGVLLQEIYMRCQYFCSENAKGCFTLHSSCSMFFSTEVTLNPPCIAFIDRICFDSYVLFKNPCVHEFLSVKAFFSEHNMGCNIVANTQHFKVYGFEKLKDNLPDWTPDTYPENFCCLFEAPLATRKRTSKNPKLFKVWSIQFREKETDSPITPDNKKIEKTLDFVGKLNPEQPAQKSSKQLTRVSLPAFLLVGFDKDSMSLVVKSVPSVFTEIKKQHKAQFEQVVGCLVHCSMISDLVVFRGNKYGCSRKHFNIELFISDKVLAMILSMFSKADVLNAMV